VRAIDRIAYLPQAMACTVLRRASIANFRSQQVVLSSVGSPHNKSPATLGAVSWTQPSRQLASASSRLAAYSSDQRRAAGGKEHNHVHLSSKSRFKYKVPLRQNVAAIAPDKPGRPTQSLERAASKLMRRPDKAAEIMEKMPPEERRRVALAWAMTELEEEFVKADKDKDGKLTYAEFKAWAFKAIETGPKRDTHEEPARKQLVYVAAAAVVPFMGFGMVDNGLMVIFGDVIDGTFGTMFGCSMLACAALGNAVSNIFGMVFHGTIHRWSEKLGLPDPHLSLQQRKLPSVHNWSTLGSTVGVFTGCLLGMTPLLFMDQTAKEEQRAHAKHDHNEHAVEKQ